MLHRVCFALLPAAVLISDVVLAQGPGQLPPPTPVVRPGGGAPGVGRLAFANADSEAAAASWLGVAGAPLDGALRQCRKRTVPSRELVIDGHPPASLGGDYWDVPFPATLSIGQQGECWQSVPAGAQGGARTPDFE